MVYRDLGLERESRIRPRILGLGRRRIRLPSPSQLANNKRPFKYNQKVNEARVYMTQVLHVSDSGLTPREVITHVVGNTSHTRAYELRGGRQRHQSQHRNHG